MLVERRSIINGLAPLPLAAVLAEPSIACTAAAGLRAVSIKPRTASGSRPRSRLRP
jgi:hypothetical protein